MATLNNTRISDTYHGLIKTLDNTAISATLKQLSDGDGNATGLSLNNAGDFKVNAILEFGSLKDTGENIIISKFVDAADGIGNNDNDTSIPTSAAIVSYVASVITAEDLDFTGDDAAVSGDVDLNSEKFRILGTANEIETSVVSAGGNQLKIGIPTNPVLTGIVTATTFSGDLNGTINTATTAVTQSAGTSNTTVATTKFVMDLDSGSDLDFSGDSGTGDVTLNTQTLAVTGTTNQIITAAANQGLSLSLPTTIHRNLLGNVEGNLIGNVTGNVSGDLTGNVTATSVLANGVSATTQASSDSSTKVATTAYVKGLDNASDLDITDGTTAGDVNLNTQSLSILGTASQVVSTVVNQSVTLSLPSSINVNSASATILQNARNLSLTGEASGIISGFNGSVNVSGAVTLDNDSVTEKVLTGLSSPTATNILASDSILQAFGKTQSQLNTLAGGLRFMGTWNATTNTPTLASGGGESASGAATGTTAFKLVDSSGGFTSGLVGDKVINQSSGAFATITNFDSNTVLTLSLDIMVSGQTYTIDNSPFLEQGHYFVVSVGGTSSLNGISNWAVGDWVIAGATNVWEKLDHTQVDGTGTVGNITKWSSTNIIADSIMAETGSGASALVTASGSIAATQLLSSGGNFAVNTDKFTVNATTGNVAVAGDLSLLDDKKLKIGTGNDLEIYHDGDNSFISDTGAGQLKIGGSQILLYNAIFGGFLARFVDGGVSELYFNTVKRFETTNSGAFVTGDLGATAGNFTGDITVPNGLISTIAGNNLTISGNVALHAGLSFATKAIIPVVVSADTDNVVDLGQSNNQFKNLYLGSEIISGGGATFGGNVGVRTDGTGASLSVQANAAANGEYTTSGWGKYIVLDAGNTGGGGIIWSKQSSTYNRGIIVNQGQFEVGRSTANDDSAAFISDLIIDSSGDAIFGGNITFGDSHFIGDDGSDNLLIQSSTGENIIIDSKDDIILDADGGDIIFKDNGTEIGRLDLAGGLALKSSVLNADIFLQGNDGGSIINALQIDMSNGGSATFRDDIDFGGKITQTGTGTNTFGGAVNIAGTLTLDQGSLLNGIINTPASLRINIDSNDNNTGEKFIVGHSQTNIDNNNILLEINESGAAEFTGNLGIGIGANGSYKLRIKSDASQENGAYISAGDSSGNHSFYVETETGNAELFAVRGDGQIRMGASGVGEVIIGSTAINSSFGASNTVLTVKGNSSGGEGILQVSGLGGNAGDNVSRISFYSQAEANPLAEIRAIRGNSDTNGRLETYTANVKRDRLDENGAYSFEGAEPGVTGVRFQGTGTCNGYVGSLASFYVMDVMRDQGSQKSMNVQGTIDIANGYGIGFGASAGSGASSTLLDDYEEGSWTPVASDFSGNNATVDTTNSVGVYTKIGDLVYWRCTIQMSSKASMVSTDTFRVAGFPFTSIGIPGNWYRPSSAILKEVTFQGFVNFSWVSNSTIGYLFDSRTGNAGTTIPVSDISDNSAMSFSGVSKVQ